MRLPALLAAALLAAAPAAHAQGSLGPLPAFRTLCVATDADRAAALAAAEGDGWSPVPDAMLASFAGQFRNAVGRLKSSSSGFSFLVLGDQERTEAGMTLHMRACGVGAVASDPAAVEAAVGTYAAVPKSTIGEGLSAWTYTDEAGRHAPLDFKDKAALKAALQTGRARVLFERDAPSPSPAMPGRLAILILAVPTS